MFRRPNLAQDVFASVLGEVQVHQDQVWNGRLGIGPLPANKGEGFASVQQVNQFKWEILFLQSPIEKEDVRGVVFNDQDSGCATQPKRVSSSPPEAATFRLIVTTCLALTIHRLGAGPTK